MTQSRGRSGGLPVLEQAMNWAIKFAVICFGAIIAVFLAIWALSGFSHFGLDADDFFFLGLGSLFTIMLAIALMAAMFASERKRQGGSD